MSDNKTPLQQVADQLYELTQQFHVLAKELSDLKARPEPWTARRALQDVQARTNGTATVKRFRHDALLYENPLSSWTEFAFNGAGYDHPCTYAFDEANKTAMIYVPKFHAPLYVITWN